MQRDVMDKEYGKIGVDFFYSLIALKLRKKLVE